MTRIYTRTGDGGTTGTADGKRMSKDSLQAQVIGDVDELNSALGMFVVDPKIQNELFDLGAQLAGSDLYPIRLDHITWLENEIDWMENSLEPLKTFILPRGPIHLARSICRRAERSAVTYGAGELIRMYLNRLSDYLFVLARYRSNGNELLWRADVHQVQSGNGD